MDLEYKNFGCANLIKEYNLENQMEKTHLGAIR